MNKPNNIDEYISSFPKETSVLLTKIRKTIQKAAPQATEKISYAMPTFYFHENLIHFAAYAKHIGLYPGPAAIVFFGKELDGYVTSKGAIQFPLDQPIPFDLIAQITSYRVDQIKSKH